MVTHRIARVLLAVAVRRWPGRLREELCREWSAELSVLAEDRRRWRMLRYAASLAVRRPARRSTTAAEILSGAWHAARLLLLAPLAAIALLAASFIGANLMLESLQSLPFVADQHPLLVTLLSLGSAVLLARLGRRWTLTGTRTVPLLLAVTIPGFTAVVALYAGNVRKLERHTPGLVVFFFGLAAILAAVSRIARNGRTRAAWWTGVLGAIVVADIAVMLPLLTIELPPDDGLDLAYAPVWLFTALTGSALGLPHPTGMEIFSIQDAISANPYAYVLFAGLALGAVIAAARQAASVAVEEQAAQAGQ